MKELIPAPGQPGGELPPTERALLKACDLARQQLGLPAGQPVFISAGGVTACDVSPDIGPAGFAAFFGILAGQTQVMAQRFCEATGTQDVYRKAKVDSIQKQQRRDAQENAGNN